MKAENAEQDRDGVARKKLKGGQSAVLSGGGLVKVDTASLNVLQFAMDLKLATMGPDSSKWTPPSRTPPSSISFKRLRRLAQEIYSYGEVPAT